MQVKPAHGVEASTAPNGGTQKCGQAEVERRLPIHFRHLVASPSLRIWYSAFVVNTFLINDPAVL